MNGILAGNVVVNKGIVIRVLYGAVFLILSFFGSGWAAKGYLQNFEDADKENRIAVTSVKSEISNLTNDIKIIKKKMGKLEQHIFLLLSSPGVLPDDSRILLRYGEDMLENPISEGEEDSATPLSLY